MAKHYKDLLVWQRAMELVEEVYRITARFPREERLGLALQLRRAAVSVPSNIAEGQGRGVGKEFLHFLRISNGSRQEVETQLLIAQRLGLAPSEAITEVLACTEECGRMLTGLTRSLATDN